MIHPIEVESYRRMESVVDLSGLTDGARHVVARIIHATADVAYAETVVVDEDAVAAGVTALRAAAPIVCDVEMVRHGLATARARCYLAVAAPADGTTRSAAGIRRACRAHPTGAVFVVGCAPTALFELVRLVAAGEVQPALVIGLPVGFVGAAASKEALRSVEVPSITNIGDKGGSAVAAAAFNALARRARM